MDVSASGARMWSLAYLPSGRRVSCRIDLGSKCTHLALRVLWVRKVSDGYEYGATCGNVVPGSESLMASYSIHVTQRRESRRLSVHEDGLPESAVA